MSDNKLITNEEILKENLINDINYLQKESIKKDKKIKDLNEQLLTKMKHIEIMSSNNQRNKINKNQTETKLEQNLILENEEITNLKAINLKLFKILNVFFNFLKINNVLNPESFLNNLNSDFIFDFQKFNEDNLQKILNELKIINKTENRKNYNINNQNIINQTPEFNLRTMSSEKIKINNEELSPISTLDKDPLNINQINNSQHQTEDLVKLGFIKKLESRIDKLELDMTSLSSIKGNTTKIITPKPLTSNKIKDFKIINKAPYNNLNVSKTKNKKL